MPKPSITSWLLLILLAILWGSSFILIKKGLMGLTPTEVGSLRIVAATVFLLPFAVKRLGQTDKKLWIYLLGAGLLGSLVPSFLFAIAQTQLESAITGVLNALVPIFTVLIGLIIFRQKQTLKVWIGVFIGFIGTAILVTAGSSGLTGINGYALLVVLATICYASNLNLIKAHLSHVHALTVTSLSLMFVGPVAFIHLFFFTEFFDRIFIDQQTLFSSFYIVLLGILGTSFALIIFNKILQATNALFASSVTYIIPPVAIIWGLVDGESLNIFHLVGMLAVGIGVYIANTNRDAYKNKGKSK